jgi:signal transduction histidine kinase
MDRPILEKTNPSALMDEAMPTMQDWLEQVARELVTVSGAIGSTIWFWSEAEQALQVEASCRMSAEWIAYGNQVARIPEAKAKAPVYLAYRTGATIELENGKSNPEYAYFSEGFQDYPMGFILTAPVGLMHRRLGAIGLYYAEPVELTQEQMLRVQLIATQIAGVRIQHDMRRQLGNKIQELEGANAYLSRANEEMMQLDRLKGNFMSAVSHELRTPLTSIMGYMELLEDEIAGPLGDRQREFVGQVQDASYALLNIVDNVLDFVRLEAGTFQLTLQEADLAEVIQRAASILQPQLEASGLTLELDFPDEPLVTRVDIRRLSQALLNLLANAYKFTPAGGKVWLRVRDAGEKVVIEVADTGIGIDPAHLPFLFDKFFQVDPGLTRNYRGVGLGLAIVKAFIEAHEGTITVTSAPGEGSVFSIALPRQGVAEA